MTDRFRFRAKALEDTPSISVKKGQFVYGYYRPENKQDEDYSSGRDVHLISMQYGDHWVDVEIDFATLGQCTGIKDKNGKLIYEGDIVRYTRYALRDLEEEFTYKGIIRWELYEFNIKNWEDEKEVIGNLHENPELLKSVTNCNQSEVDK